MSDFVIENGELVKYTGNGGDVIIPNSVTTIGICAFSKCTRLINVIIPETVTSIGVDVFFGCKNLTSINVSEQNSNYASLDGVLYDKKKTMLICCPARKKSVIIPDSVTEIKFRAFEGCTSLNSITIPNSVTSIEIGAFSECKSLNSITISSSVTNIGHWAFDNCTNLTNLSVDECTIHGKFGRMKNFTGKLKKSLFMLNKKDFSIELETAMKYPFILAYYRKTKDENALIYIKKQFSKIVTYAIEQNDIETIQILTEVDNLFTKKNIDKFIQTAIDNQRHEIYVILLNYKAEKIGFKDIKDQFKL